MTLRSTMFRPSSRRSSLSSRASSAVVVTRSRLKRHKTAGAQPGAKALTA
eukprot:CAMPEP_0179198850 /NCGR_PEP_ID=MMETSP0796-20121207/98919_1 /TAXON_ID=73915 /ORGANISM="Pyrodinium bahamense, Strain pbaha01" /LENGTH=49 /DNA_ID= /DNA_START= /DNA_END= /DNA_ORIENTATION=